MTAIIVAVLVALTPFGGAARPSNPVLFGGGGPDPYGYRYLDSDTVCAGAPTYNWVEIKGLGTQITGLGDDNTVGPFNIGFEFPYYWYRVTQIHVGSNGYVAFHDNAMDGTPFQHIPSPERPNNLLAPLLSDMDCGAGGSVWYWGNADTFVVEFDSVKFWNTGGNNTFEVILSRPDSSITFQYKEQSGTPYNGWAPDNNQTGIENATGSIGLSYLSGNYPLQNMYHSSLVVLFFPPESTTYQVHDCGIRNAMNDRGGGMFALNNAPMTLWAVARNFGNQVEADFQSYVTVKRQNGTVVFSDSMTTSVPNPGDIDSLVFPNTWTPSSNGVYTVIIYTMLAGDVFPTNDTATVELHVITMPATLSYDKGTPDAFYSWPGQGGYGSRFVPPVYPCSVMTVRFMAGAGSATDCRFGIFDDNGPGGSPGDTLFIQTVSVSTQTWYTATLTTPVVIEDGAFFVGAMSSDSGAPSFGMDTVPPMSGQSWEYTGLWAPSRDAWVREAMFNAGVTAVGISEWLYPGPATEPLRIVANPNPFGTASLLRLSAPSPARAIEVYDATGTLVRTLALSRGAAKLDGRRMAEGIYFARLAADDSPVAKLVICR